MADLCRCHQRPLVAGKCSRPRGTGPTPIYTDDTRPARISWVLSEDIRAWLWQWAAARGVEGYNGVITAEAALQAIRETLRAYNEA